MRALLLATLLGSSVTLANPLIFPSNYAGLSIRGPGPGLDWGQPLAAGDFDNDGFEDLVIAASRAAAGESSRVFIIRGRGGLAGAGQIDLADIPADQVIQSGEPEDNLGSSVAAGDVNDDMIDDLLLVASGADFSGRPDRGVAYLIYGDPDFFQEPVRNLQSDEAWDLRLLGPVTGGDMGGSSLFGGEDAQAAAIGDVNGDGIGDIILGVHLADGSKSTAGRVYVRFGSASEPTSRTLNLASSNTRDVEIWGQGEFDQLGTMVTSGDITGDGIDELIIGNPSASRGVFSTEGVTYVLRGRTEWPAFINLFNTDADLTILGGRLNDNVGQSVTVGDFNNDTFGDLAIAAPGAELGPVQTQQGDGVVYIFCGGPQFAEGQFFFDLLTDPADAIFVGEPRQRLGSILQSADINLDGFSDLIASQPNAGSNANGVVEVLFGRDFVRPAQFHSGIDTNLRIYGNPNEQLGVWVGTSDFNGDGRPEILCSSPDQNAVAGTVYAWYVAGDTDLDGDVDAFDLAVFQRCLGENDGRPLSPECQRVDFTLDGFVSSADWLAFEMDTQGPLASEEDWAD